MPKSHLGSPFNSVQKYAIPFYVTNFWIRFSMFFFACMYVSAS